MKKTYYFMSGLPRSGSSLLSAILNQNDRFYCGPSSPVVTTMVNLEDHLKKDELFNAYPKDCFKNSTIGSLLENYYQDVDKPVIIDKNRSWNRRLGKITEYYGIETPKVICTVRDLPEILASFITMIHRNKSTGTNFIDKELTKLNVPINDFTRCQLLAGDGPLGRSYTSLQIAFDEGFKNNLHFVEYNDLVNTPNETMKSIYDFLGEEYYQHDFTNLVNVHREDDGTIYGLPDMHDVRTELKSIAKNPKDVLPAKVIEDVSGLEFWRK